MSTATAFRFSAYVVAVSSTVGAWLAAIALRPILPQSPIPLLCLAVTVAAWRGGLGPGLTSTALAVVGLAALGWVRGAPGAALLDLVVVGGGGALVSALGAARHRARESERQRERLAALVEVGRRLTRGLELPAVLDAIAEAAAAMFHGEAAFRLIEGEHLVRSGATPGAREMMPGRLRIGQSVSGRVAATGEPIVSGDIVADPRVIPAHRSALRDASLGALLCVPLRAGARVLGTLNIYRERGYRFDAGAVGLAQSLADQAGIAIENARLYEEAERRRGEAEAIAELTQAITSTLDLPTILVRATERARDLCHADRAMIALRDRAGEAMIVRYLAGARSEVYGGHRVEPGKGVGGQVLLTGRPFRTSDYVADPRLDLEYHTRFGKDASAASMAVPIRIDGQIEGLLYAQHLTVHDFTDHEEATLVRLAEHAAIAIANARLFAREQEARAKAEAAAEALRTSEAQLRQSQKMEAIGRLAGGIAHDFNNLLTVIKGRTQLVQRSLGPDDPRCGQIRLIEESAERASALTRQLLAFSRKQILEPTVLDLNAVVRDMKAMLERLIGEDVELITRAEAGAGRVRGDRGQLEQVIMNLVVNARDAMPRDGRVTLRTMNAELTGDFVRGHPALRPGSFVVLEVRDTGTGMDAETRARIFEPFFTTKGQGRGTGLGLSTVYGIVEQHGGCITVASEVGQGATFHVYLPQVDEPEAARAGEAPGATSELGAETILLVEDETGVRDLVRDILEMHGYAVLEAANGPEALVVSGRHPGPIALVLTDVIMPGMSGYELAQRLARQRPDMRVLYMSGYTDPIVHHGMRGRGVAFLGKPFSPDAVARKVREVLRAPAAGSGHDS